MSSCASYAPFGGILNLDYQASSKPFYRSLYFYSLKRVPPQVQQELAKIGKDIRRILSAAKISHLAVTLSLGFAYSLGTTVCNSVVMNEFSQKELGYGSRPGLWNAD